MKASLVVAGAVMLLYACAQLGLTVPQSTSQRLAYAYSTVTGVRQQAALMLETKRISVADAQQVQKLADIARLSLDQAASQLKLGDQTNALQTMQLAEQVLVQLQSFLKAKQDQPKGTVRWELPPRLQSS